MLNMLPLHIRDAWSDLRLATRLLWRDRNATMALVFTLSVGIGANVATFAVLDRVLFQPPRGVHEPGTVRRFVMQGAIGGQPSMFNAFSYPTVADFRAAVPSVSFAGYEPSVTRPFGETGDEAAVSYVTNGFFDVLGVRTHAGSVPQEPEFAHGIDWVVLSHGFWTRALGADSSVVGRTIKLDGKPVLVLGVAQRGFEGIDLEPVELWASVSSRMGPGDDSRLDRSTIGRLRVIGRVRGVANRSIEERLTQAFLASSGEALRLSASTRIHSAPLLEALGPVLPGQNRANLLLAQQLADIALVVLLASLTNAAGLLLMRIVQRRRVTAVRLALGSPFSRIVRFTLVESLVLACVVGPTGLLAGWWAGGILRSALVIDVRWTASPLIHRSFVLALLLGAGCALLASLVPLLIAGRAQALEALRQHILDADLRGARLRRVLLAVQIAISVALLSAGGALVRDIRAETQVDAGIDTGSLVSVDASGRLLTAVDVHRALESLRSIAGIDDVALATWDIRPSRRNTNLAVRSHVRGVDSVKHHPVTLVDSNYFRVAGLRVIDGRGISGTDVRGAEIAIVISRSMADLYWPSGGSVGQCLAGKVFDAALPPLSAGHDGCLRIIGVVEDIRWNPRDQERPYAYLAVDQFDMVDVCCHNLLVRAGLPVSPSTVREIAEIIRAEFPPGVSPARVSSVASRLEPFTRPLRIAAALVIVCGALALVSMSIGLYGVVAYEVRQRTPELVVRITLGASHVDILRLVMSSTVRAVSVGVLIGVAATLIGSRHIIETPPGRVGTDYVSMAIVVVTVVLSVGLATLSGVRRLWTLNAAAALRAD